MSAVCSPIERPVRGSALRGKSGTIWPGRIFVSALIRSVVERAAFASSRISRRSSLSEIGASEVVSEPPAIAGVGLAEGDLVRDQDRRLEAGAARLADVVGRRLRRELRAEDRLARQVDVARVLEHGAGGDLAEALALEPVLRGDAVDDRRQHVLVRRLRVLRVRARERNAVSPEDVRRTCLVVHCSCVSFIEGARHRAWHRVRVISAGRRTSCSAGGGR